MAENDLTHVGVKGMKWGRRKDRMIRIGKRKGQSNKDFDDEYDREIAETNRYLKKQGNKQKAKLRKVGKKVLGKQTYANLSNKKAWSNLLRGGVHDAALTGVMSAGLSYLFTGSKKAAAESALRAASISAVLNASIGTYKIAKTGELNLRKG